MYVTSALYNVLSKNKVVQMLIFTLQKNIWKRIYNYYQYSIIISIQIKHTQNFFCNTSFLGFYYTNMFFFCCEIWVYLKSQNGVLYVTAEHRHLGR